MCQEHSRKYHKQELRNFMSPRCWLPCSVRLGSWHPHHMAKGSRVRASQSARLHVTHSARPSQLQSIRFWLSAFWEWGQRKREHTHAHTALGRLQTQAWAEVIDPRITVFNQNTVDGKTNRGEGFRSC